MCIFSRPVISVKDTQIFARPTGAGSQFLAYQMGYESAEENAMILPLPVSLPAHEGSVRFIDLKNYEAFFLDLDKGFPYKSPVVSIGCSAPQALNADGSMLEVFEVGNYIASFVPTLDDFSRIDPRFSLPKEAWEQVPQYLDYGFAVFQLASGSSRPHPMAFEFETESKSVYFPTMHIHDGDVHEREDFDHVLYTQHAGFDSVVHGYVNSDVNDKSTGLVRSKHVASRFCSISKTEGLVDGNLLVHRKVIRGQHPNQDTEFFAAGDPVKAAFNMRPLLSYAPWLFVVAACAWFFRRRNRIRKA